MKQSMARYWALALFLLSFIAVAWAYAQSGGTRREATALDVGHGESESPALFASTDIVPIVGLPFDHASESEERVLDGAAAAQADSNEFDLVRERSASLLREYDIPSELAVAILSDPDKREAFSVLAEEQHLQIESYSRRLYDLETGVLGGYTQQHPELFLPMSKSELEAAKRRHSGKAWVASNGRGFLVVDLESLTLEPEVRETRQRLLDARAGCRTELCRIAHAIVFP